jgi:uncharacterized SAM-binding protein YcdF (DUF218 family)
MKAWIYKLGIVLIIILLAVGGCRRAGNWLVKEDVPGQADVMLMLMGGYSARIQQIVDLYDQNISGNVWIVEAETGLDPILEDQGVVFRSRSYDVFDAFVSLGIPEDSLLVVPGKASSTRMEAEIIRDYLKTSEDIGSLLLVTSPNHSKRAYKIFKAAFSQMEDPPSLYCSGSKYSTVNLNKWWKSRDDIEEVVLEYIKVINFYLFERRALRKG